MMCRSGYTLGRLWAGRGGFTDVRVNDITETRLQTSLRNKNRTCPVLQVDQRGEKSGEINSNPADVQSAAGEEAESCLQPSGHIICACQRIYEWDS